MAILKSMEMLHGEYVLLGNATSAIIIRSWIIIMDHIYRNKVWTIICKVRGRWGKVKVANAELLSRYNIRIN